MMHIHEQFPTEPEAREKIKTISPLAVLFSVLRTPPFLWDFLERFWVIKISISRPGHRGSFALCVSEATSRASSARIGRENCDNLFPSVQVLQGKSLPLSSRTTKASASFEIN